MRAAPLPARRGCAGAAEFAGPNGEVLDCGCGDQSKAAHRVRLALRSHRPGVGAATGSRRTIFAVLFRELSGMSA